jgi:hypothetical protein
MQIDPVQEWQRLTAEYREIRAVSELLELGRRLWQSDSTPRSRCCAPRCSAAGWARREAEICQALQSAQRERNSTFASAEQRAIVSDPDIASGELGIRCRTLQIGPDTPGCARRRLLARTSTRGRPSYASARHRTRKRQLVAALRQAGIDSWIDGPASGTRYRSASLASPRVLVAADQLDQARAIAAQSESAGDRRRRKRKFRSLSNRKCPKCGVGGRGSRRRRSRKHVAMRAMR